MLGPKPFDQVRDRGRRPLLLDGAERVAAVLDLAAELARLVAGVRGAPRVGAADGVRSLPPRSGGVAQDVAAGLVGGDADAEAEHSIVEGDLAALLRHRKPTHHRVGQMLPCHLRYISVMLTPCHDRRCNERVQTLQRETPMWRAFLSRC